MSKRLPYFQFEPAEYLAGDIMFCSYSAQGMFNNICALYWQKDCDLKYSQTVKRFNNEELIKELISEKIIKISGDKIIINFLDEQFAKATEKSSINSENGKKGALKRWRNDSEANGEIIATPLKSDSETIALREDKIKEKEIKEDKKELSLSLENDFILFWNKYNKKTDLKKCKDKFLKLKQSDIDDILKVTDKYVLLTPDVKFRKNPLTWLNGECWKDLSYKKTEAISTNGEKMIKYISNVNPTPSFLEESKFLLMQERNLKGGYIYKILP